MRDQVQSYHFEGFRVFRYGDSVYGCFTRVRLCFVLLAHPTSFDVLGDPRPHSGPFVVSCYLLICLVSPQMSPGWRVVIESQDFSLALFRQWIWVGGLDERFRGNQRNVRVVFLSFVCIRGS